MLSRAEVSLPIHVLLRCNSIGYFFCVDGLVGVERQLHYKAMDSWVCIQRGNALEHLQQQRPQN